jgi:alkylation response protein AidB-like acyl-CoA dehydrogenase
VSHLDELRTFLAGQPQPPEVDNPTFVRALGEAGWVMPHWTPEHGGRGLTPEQAAEVAAELDHRGLPRQPRGSGLVLAAPAIREWSDEATKRRFLPPILSGAERWCQLYSEPGAGSDLASLATTAVRDGDEWIVNGQKVWTTYGHESEMAMLLARTDPMAPKHKGITYFGMDMHAPGVEIRPLVQMTGENEFNEVFLTEVRIPDLFRISPVGQGWAATQTTLGAERTALSGTKGKKKASDEILGGKTVAEVLELARSLGDRLGPAQRDDLVRAVIESRVLELSTSRRLHGSLTKIAKARTNQQLQIVAIALLGARATAWDPDDDGDAEVPGFVRELLRTRANSIEGGTSEIQRNIVGERVLGLPREPDATKGLPWSQVPRS